MGPDREQILCLSTIACLDEDDHQEERVTHEFLNYPSTFTPDCLSVQRSNLYPAALSYVSSILPSHYTHFVRPQPDLSVTPASNVSPPAESLPKELVTGWQTNIVDKNRSQEDRRD